MAYEKQTWVDGETPLDAEHLNHMEQGIADADKNAATQSDWNATDSDDPSFIKNKPRLDFMSTTNPTATGSFSMGRKIGTTVGTYSHAEGNNTTASGMYSHAEGSYTTASGQQSHAEGSGTTASGVSAHAEGSCTTASGSQSHAEGGGTTASGSQSHAEGNNTTASGVNAHAEGVSTKASGDNQHVQGKYNIEDTESTYAHIVGNGASGTERSNAHTLDWEGNAWYAGEVQATDFKVKQPDGTYTSIINLPEGANQQLITDENGNTVWQEQLAYEFGEVFVQILNRSQNNLENIQLTNPIDITPGKSYQVTFKTGGYPAPNFQPTKTYTYDAIAVSGNDGISYIECGEAKIKVYSDGRITNSFYDDGNPYSSLTISRKDKNIKRIDKKFLAEPVSSDMACMQLVTDYNGDPIWEDKLGYVLEKRYALLASILNCKYYPSGPSGVNGYIVKIRIANSLNFIEGEKYRIRRYSNDNNAVEAIAQAREDGVIYVGCPDLENISSDLKYSAYSDGYIYSREGIGYETNYYIEHVIDEEVKQFDPRLIPNVLGKYNIDDADGIYAYIVGNGTGENARSNAYTLDRFGNAWYAGAVYVGGDGTNYNPETAKKLATEEYVQNLIGAVDELLGSGVIS